jgi:transketolase
LAERDGIEVGVLDAVYLKPLDEAAVLAAAERTGTILAVEEANVLGGLGGAVAEVLAEAGVPCRFARHGIRDEYAEIAPPTHLWRHYGLDPEGIADRVRKLLA